MAGLRRLLSKGLPVDTRMGYAFGEPTGYTLLDRAVIRRDVSTVRMLLSKGANPHTASEPYYSPTQTAMSCEDRRIVDLFLASPKVTKRAINTEGLLHFAVNAGNYYAIDELLKRGADINGLGGPDSDGEHRPLHYAVDFKNPKMLEYLIERGARVDGRDTGGETPLFRAMAWGHDEVVAALVKHGADVNAKSELGETPLSTITEYSDRDEEGYRRAREILRRAGAI